MKVSITIVFALALCAFFLNAQTVIDFEEFNLPAESFLNGSDGGGGFTSGDIFLPNNYDPAFDAWSGWSISNTTDVTTPGFTNPYSAIAGGGFGGSPHYAVTYDFGNNNLVLTGDAAGKIVAGMYITNNTYAYLSIRDGDSFSKKFGGVTGNDPDYFLLTVRGYFSGELTADSVDFYLADYRFSDNNQDYIVDEWEFVDLSALGLVDSLSFTLSSTDVGQFGMNTPAFFCVDNILLSSEPTVAARDVVRANPFRVFPNPTTDYVRITHAGNEIMDCLVFDMNGRLVARQRLEADGGRLDLQFLPKGNYVLQLQGKRAYSAQMVVKQ